MVLIVRHGESAAEVPGKPFSLRDGHGDPELHSHGRRQAELLADRLEREGVDAIYVTTLQRTHQTAAPLARRLGVTPIEEPDLREVFLGEWEGGIFRSKAIDNDPVFQEIFRQERWDVIPGAEPHDEFDARVWSAFQRIVAAHTDQRVMVVAHGGVIGHLLHRVTDSRRFAFSVADNASISEVVAVARALRAAPVQRRVTPRVVGWRVERPSASTGEVGPGRHPTQLAVPGKHLVGLLLDRVGGRGQQDRTVRGARERQRRLSGGRDHASLIRRPELDIDEKASIFLALADDLTGDDLRVADVVELPDLVVLTHDPTVVADPVGEVVRQPRLAHDPVVVGHRVADRCAHDESQCTRCATSGTPYSFFT